MQFTASSISVAFDLIIRRIHLQSRGRSASAAGFIFPIRDISIEWTLGIDPAPAADRGATTKNFPLRQATAAVFFSRLLVCAVSNKIAQFPTNFNHLHSNRKLNACNWKKQVSAVDEFHQSMNVLLEAQKPRNLSWKNSNEMARKSFVERQSAFIFSLNHLVSRVFISSIANWLAMRRRLKQQ